jgi:hypothetical protein
MSAQPKINDIVLISNGQTSRNYVIRNINQQGIYISPQDNPNELNLLIQGPNGWQVYGTTVPYQIIFVKQLFSSVPDVDIIILNNIDDDVLEIICRTNQYLNSLCNNDRLWIERIRKNFGEESLNNKPADQSWRTYYFNQIQHALTNPQALIVKAALVGNINMLKWLLRSGYDPTSLDTAIAIAARGGHKDMLKWLVEQNIAPETVFMEVIQYRLYDMLDWLDQQGILPPGDALAIAAGHGDLDILQRYAARGILPSAHAADFAQQEGHTEVLRWLTENNIFPN